jgi:hypothetical protein
MAQQSLDPHARAAHADAVAAAANAALGNPFADSASAPGLPADRSARLAARRAFVDLKLSFLFVVEGLQEPNALKAQVRLAETPEQLWALRAPVYAALAGTDAAQTRRRQLLNRSLESMFGDSRLGLTASEFPQHHD